jgi:L-amino acid N-acyltransferase YncA
MKIHIRTVADADWGAVTAIFNHFVADSFAAYMEQPVDDTFFKLHHEANPNHPFLVTEAEGRLLGFAYLSPFHSADSLRCTATVTYFVHPDFTGKSIGSAFLKRLLRAGEDIGVTNILAHVSSLNPGSIHFHVKNGFVECGRFRNVGVKNGRPYDMVWLQKLLV